MLLMNEYLLFAILSPIFWAIVNIIDDYQIKRIYKTPSLAIIMTGIFLVVPLLFAFTKIQNLDLNGSLVGILAGVCLVLSSWLYFKALSTEDTAVVIALWSLTPVGVYILSYLFLGEVLTKNQTIGSMVIVAGSVLISLLGKRRYRFSPTLLIMLVSSALYSVSSILEKQTYIDSQDFYSGYLFITLGTIIGTVFFVLRKKNFLATVSVFRTQKKYLIFIVVSEAINIAAIFFQNLAVSFGNLTIVKVIEGTQPIFVLVITLILALFFRYYKKSVDYKTIAPKLIIIILMFVGFTLMN